MVGLDRGRQGRIARNKKARTGRASWVFRRLSETGLDSYLVEPGGIETLHSDFAHVPCLLGFTLTPVPTVSHLGGAD